MITAFLIYILGAGLNVKTTNLDAVKVTNAVMFFAFWPITTPAFFVFAAYRIWKYGRVQ